MTAKEHRGGNGSEAALPVRLILRPAKKDLGGFMVRRLLPAEGAQMVGPWIFFDHIGPAAFDAGTGIDVRPHPHINLATVTYLFEGEILHRDSLGSVQAIRPGDINLMVAGRGIVHSERERPEVRACPHRLHGVQLWLALPERDELTDPAFHHYSSQHIPAIQGPGLRLRVIMGEAQGARSPVRTFARTLCLDAELDADSVLGLPRERELAVYVVAGLVDAGGCAVEAGAMAVLRPGAMTRLRARQASRLLIVGGDPVGERHIEWNFVSSRRERIEEARRRWRAGKFEKVPGDEEEFIPLP